MFDPSGRRALVTDSPQGIGLMLAKALASAGAHIIINSRNRGKRRQARENTGGNPLQLVFDLMDHAATHHAIDTFEATVSAIDIPVNNAGIQYPAPPEDFPAQEFARLLHSNISGVFNAGQAVHA